MIFLTDVIVFQKGLTKLTVTARWDSGLPFSSDLACQLLFNFLAQISCPLSTD